MLKIRLKKILLILFTLGFIYRKWNKALEKKENTVYQSAKLPFDFKELFLYLGGPENLKSLEKTTSRVLVFFEDKSLIDQNKLMSLKGINGIFFKSDSIALVLGEYTQVTYDKLLEQKHESK
ncbi:PTS glucose enzyme IIB subunit [Mycoplasmopsis synoviae]|uniref:PTS glucose enzyme IIB subunit n=1 Tax=Mycoplasmopsis synoviae TaxID=2109 RepID=A0AAX3EZ05_MYCSY|nr:PTS glucose enzyme IIB subunit [Mycoplasmopsis synoviae]QGL44932.1 PTS glucose enzyme IIB subunit [Mycoplasmopsis synoviae]QXV99254.1 PTS glucose enzyme IIB subunit [Mycoplasmopsis synoviae]UBM43433.1 PTS glucose enzyme IIB subunit [Mycoplasmopsis synoviae]ULL02204.1 PTS glucose enzyme IIB subunit [Mycoplasmopsis synoviae]UZW63546.1 PTS glucose enzyme IIB subunit [Mycoplasmopsis synoviae]